MKKIFLLAGAVAMLVLGSCKKDKNSDGDNNGGNTKLLKKLTRTENGKTTVYNFTYDGNKLTSFSSSDNLETTAFNFDGAGNITKLENRSNSYISTYTFSYNNGIPVNGNVKVLHNIGGTQDVVQDDVLTYTVVNNQVSKIRQESKLDGTVTTANLTYTSNGNLEKLGIEGDEPFFVTFTYGTKKPGFPTISKWVLDMGYTLQFSTKNETLTAFYDFPGTQIDKTVTTTYTYDADGYPLTSNDGETQLKFEY